MTFSGTLYEYTKIWWFLIYALAIHLMLNLFRQIVQ